MSLLKSTRTPKWPPAQRLSTWAMAATSMMTSNPKSVFTEKGRSMGLAVLRMGSSSAGASATHENYKPRSGSCTTAGIPRGGRRTYRGRRKGRDYRGGSFHIRDGLADRVELVLVVKHDGTATAGQKAGFVALTVPLDDRDAIEPLEATDPATPCSSVFHHD